MGSCFMLLRGPRAAAAPQRAHAESGPPSAPHDTPLAAERLLSSGPLRQQRPMALASSSCCRSSMRPWQQRRAAAVHCQVLQPLRKQCTAAGKRLRCPQAAPSPDAGASAQAINAAVFGRPEVVAEFMQKLPADVEQRLAAIASLLPPLDPADRVIDVGSGTGCLLPHLRERGASDILAVDLSPAMLQQLAARFPPPPGRCGNEPGVRAWQGDFLDLPAFQGPASAITMNAVFGNFASPRDALIKAALLLRPGGHLLISHPMGRAWHAQLAAEQPGTVPHVLPDEAALQHATADLPLRLLDFRDEPQLYAALLQVPPNYALPAGPLALESDVVTGFGRGSRQLGVPTANMDPAPLQEQLAGLPRGVYFGWAQVDAAPGSPPADSGVHMMVMNVGRRPTVNTGDEAPTVEVHILHRYAAVEFYGACMRVAAAGFLRPEIRFAGLQQLLARIRADIGIAKAQLAEPAAAALKQHASFKAR